MEFIDLKTQYQELRHNIQVRFERVFAHGKFVLGPEVEELEKQLASFNQSHHCIAMGSGTDALLIAMMALDIGPQDEVIVPAFTFIAPAEMVAFLGATPVFVDIDPITYGLAHQTLERAITKRTKAIIVVNLFGQCADYDAINEIAKKHKLPVIEDGAQSFGATYKNHHSCNLTTIGCTSFFPSKPLGCYGDGGACFTNDDLLALKMRQIANHGQVERYEHVRLGLNSRLDTLQAAVLLEKLVIFPRELQLRMQVAAIYHKLLSDVGIKPPHIISHNTSTYAQYTIEVANRSLLQGKLSELAIPTAVHYPSPLHLQPVFKKLDYRVGDFPCAEKAAQMVMSLPMHPYLSQEQQHLIVSQLANNWQQKVLSTEELLVNAE